MTDTIYSWGQIDAPSLNSIQVFVPKVSTYIVGHDKILKKLRVCTLNFVSDMFGEEKNYFRNSSQTEATLRGKTGLKVWPKLQRMRSRQSFRHQD